MKDLLLTLASDMSFSTCKSGHDPLNQHLVIREPVDSSAKQKKVLFGETIPFGAIHDLSPTSRLSASAQKLTHNKSVRLRSSEDQTPSFAPLV